MFPVSRAVSTACTMMVMLDSALASPTLISIFRVLVGLVNLFQLSVQSVMVTLWPLPPLVSAM